MRETSLLAFIGIEAELPKKRKVVFEAIRNAGDDGMTLFELVEVIRRPINELSGRVTELSKAKWITPNGRRSNPDTKKLSTVWIVAHGSIEH